MCPSDNIKKLPNSDKSPPQKVKHDMSREDFLKEMDSAFTIFERLHRTVIKIIKMKKEDVMSVIEDDSEHDEDVLKNVAHDLLYIKRLIGTTNSLHAKVSTVLDNFRNDDQSENYWDKMSCTHSVLSMATKVHERIFKSLDIYI